jgi:hypothetical protein
VRCGALCARVACPTPASKKRKKRKWEKIVQKKKIFSLFRRVPTPRACRTLRGDAARTRNNVCELCRHAPTRAAARLSVGKKKKKKKKNKKKTRKIRKKKKDFCFFFFAFFLFASWRDALRVAGVCAVCWRRCRAPHHTSRATRTQRPPRADRKKEEKKIFLMMMLEKKLIFSFFLSLFSADVASRNAYHAGALRH